MTMAKNTGGRGTAMEGHWKAQQLALRKDTEGFQKEESRAPHRSCMEHRGHTLATFPVLVTVTSGEGRSELSSG